MESLRQLNNATQPQTTQEEYLVFFVGTKAGYIVPRITGSISFFSSLFIITFILRSKSNTVYHRIMMLICIFDMIASFAIALTTIPLPPEAFTVYPLAGRESSYGSQFTCELQGFLFYFGSGEILMLGAVLNIYYLCKLRYNMEDEQFRKKLEPFLYLVSLLSILVPAILLWLQGLYNPTPRDPYCAMQYYPENCTLETNPECRGDWHGSGVRVNALLCILFVLLIALLTLVISMGLIFASYCSNERRLSKQLKSIHELYISSQSQSQSKLPDAACIGTTDDSPPTMPIPMRVQQAQEGPMLDAFNLTTRHEEQIIELQHLKRSRRTVAKQAVMYLSAFILTWIWVLIERVTHDHYIVPMLRLIFQPSQGFFNMLIFFYHKAYVAVKEKEEMTIRAALVQLILSPAHSAGRMRTIDNLDLIGKIEIEEKMKKRAGFGYELPSSKPNKSVHGRGHGGRGHVRGHSYDNDNDGMLKHFKNNNGFGSIDGERDNEEQHYEAKKDTTINSDPDPDLSYAPSSVGGKLNSLFGFDFDGISFAPQSQSASTSKSLEGNTHSNKINNNRATGGSLLSFATPSRALRSRVEDESEQCKDGAENEDVSV